MYTISINSFTLRLVNTTRSYPRKHKNTVFYWSSNTGWCDLHPSGLTSGTRYKVR